MLEIHNLRAVRGQLNFNYHFQVATGKVMVIRGLSGVGKTTLLEAIAGFAEIEQGKIIWQDTEIQHLPAALRPVSMMFQDHNLFEHLSIDENIQLGMVENTSAKSALENLNLIDQLSKLPSELSGGQRQRIALIRTILRPEPLVLLDEPFSELDSETRLHVIKWAKATIRSLGKTVLLVTHQNKDIHQIADTSIKL